MRVDWPRVVTVLGIAIPLIAALIAAWMAKRSADRATEAQLRVAHLQRVEERLSSRKRQVYQPALDYLRTSLDDAENIDLDEMKDTLGEFTGWLAIVGSDDAVRALGRYMQGSFNSAPGFVAMRLYAEFQLAARRDLGDTGSELTAVDLWSMCVNDMYADTPDAELFRKTLSQPLDDVAALHGWKLPWGGSAD